MCRGWGQEVVELVKGVLEGADDLRGGGGGTVDEEWVKLKHLLPDGCFHCNSKRKTR
jgi:hypothetical protein